MHHPITSSTRALPLLALLALTLPHLALGQNSPPAPADDLIVLTSTPLTLAQVRALYGEPAQRIGADLWVYWNFPVAHLDAQRAGYDTLIVHTTGEFARTIKLVRGTELRALLRQLGHTKRLAAVPVPPASRGV